MSHFCREQFLSLLQAAPEKRPLLEPPEYSAYLQAHVFDRLKDEGCFDLAALDWEAVQLCQLIPVDYAAQFEDIDRGWLWKINSFLRQTAAASQTDRSFF